MRTVIPVDLVARLGLRCGPAHALGSERAAALPRPQELLDPGAQLTNREPLGQADPLGLVTGARDPCDLCRGGPRHAPIVQGAVERGEAVERFTKSHPFLGGTHGYPEALPGVVREAREAEPDVTAGTAQAPQAKGQGAVDRAGDPAHASQLKVEQQRGLEAQEPAPFVAEGDVEHAFREAEGEVSSRRLGLGVWGEVVGESEPEHSRRGQGGGWV